MLRCPNKNTKAWKNMVNRLGIDNANHAYVVNSFDLLEDKDIDLYIANYLQDSLDNTSNTSNTTNNKSSNNVVNNDIAEIVGSSSVPPTANFRVSSSQNNSTDTVQFSRDDSPYTPNNILKAINDYRSAKEILFTMPSEDEINKELNRLRNTKIKGDVTDDDIYELALERQDDIKHNEAQLLYIAELEADIEKFETIYKELREHEMFKNFMRDPETFAPIIAGAIYNYEPPQESIGDTDEYNNIDAVLTLANTLKERLNINFEIVSAKEAAALIRTKNNNNLTISDIVNGFYHRDKSYLVKERLSVNTTIHEFAHPLVDALVADNFPVFDKMYNEILSTPDGKRTQELVNKLYKDQNDITRKKEIFVRILSDVAKNNIDKETGEPITNAITRFLNWVKQFFTRRLSRKILNRETISVFDFDLDTTIQELADIITLYEGKIDLKATREPLDESDYKMLSDSFFTYISTLSNSTQSVSISDFLKHNKERISDYESEVNDLKSESDINDDTVKNNIDAINYRISNAKTSVRNLLRDMRDLGAYIPNLNEDVTSVKDLLTSELDANVELGIMLFNGKIVKDVIDWLAENYRELEMIVSESVARNESVEPLSEEEQEEWHYRNMFLQGENRNLLRRIQSFRNTIEDIERIKTFNKRLSDNVVDKIQFARDEDEVNYNKTARDIEQQLIDGFLKDFGITVTDYRDIKEVLGFNASSAVDMITKTIVREPGESIIGEVAYIAYKMLGKANNKLRSDLNYTIHRWEKYNERYDYHVKQYKDNERFVNSKPLFKRLIKEKVIADFLTEHLENFNPESTFEKVKDVRWTSDDDYGKSLWSKIVRAITDLLRYFGIDVNKEKHLNKLKAIGMSIADEVLNRNYEYYNYDKTEDQILKDFNETLSSDPKAKEIINHVLSNTSLILTGSIAYRKAGTTYRSSDEAVHDIDFIVPYESSMEFGKDIGNIDPKSRLNRDVVLELLYKQEWFKVILEKYPNWKLNTSFTDNTEEIKYNGKTDTVTVLGVIDGEYRESDGEHSKEIIFYTKDPITKKAIKNRKTVNVSHKKGDWIEGSGYQIDFFIRLKPNMDEHENSFKLWKQVFKAKLQMGREKDMIDWKYFVPFIKSKDNYDFKYQQYRHISYKDDVVNALDNTEQLPRESESNSSFSLFTPKSQNDLLAKQELIKVAKSLSSKLDIPYALINEPAMRWAGCFKDGKVHLNIARVTAETPFHEFAHPFISSVRISNPDLYNNLLSELKSTKYGKALLEETKELYDNGTRTIQEIEEEAIVELIARFATGKLNQQTTDKDKGWLQTLIAFLRYIGNLLFKYSSPVAKTLNYSSPIHIEDISSSMRAIDIANLLRYGTKINGEHNTLFYREHNTTGNLSFSGLFDMQNEYKVSDVGGAYHFIGVYMNNAGINTVSQAIKTLSSLLEKNNRLELATSSGNSNLDYMLETATLSISFKQETPIKYAFVKDIGSELVKNKAGELVRVVPTKREQYKYNDKIFNKPEERDRYDELFINANKNNIASIIINNGITIIDPETKEPTIDTYLKYKQELIELSEITGAPIMTVSEGKPVILYSPTVTKEYKPTVKFSMFAEQVSDNNTQENNNLEADKESTTKTSLDDTLNVVLIGKSLSKNDKNILSELNNYPLTIITNEQIVSDVAAIAKLKQQIASVFAVSSNQNLALNIMSVGQSALSQSDLDSLSIILTSNNNKNNC